MGIADLGSVLKVFGGSDPTEEEQAALFKEVFVNGPCACLEL